MVGSDLSVTNNDLLDGERLFFVSLLLFDLCDEYRIGLSVTESFVGLMLHLHADYSLSQSIIDTGIGAQALAQVVEQLLSC